MQLRWLIRKNYITAEHVRAYAIANDVSLLAAKSALENVSPPVLQFRLQDTDMWDDVPFEYIPHGEDVT